MRALMLLALGTALIACDSGDPKANSDCEDGASEVCDGLDNDCDGVTDEGFDTLGEVCFAGQGSCQRQGTIVCAPSGTEAECSTVAAEASEEVCDGVDNDCNGMVDDQWFDGTNYSDDTACGNCATDCTALFQVADGFGQCESDNGPVGCALTCCTADSTNSDCDGLDHFDLNGFAPDGCEFVVADDAVYVSNLDVGAADDADCGAGPSALGGSNHPCLTISAGIARAALGGVATVLVSEGTYTEQVVLASGISLLGGHNRHTWERDSSAYSTTVFGVPDASHPMGFVLTGVSGVTVDGFVVFAANATTATTNSYGFYISQCGADVTIANNRVFAGNGAQGDSVVSGVAGGAGAAGASGNNSTDAVGTCFVQSTAGGLGGATVCNGVNTSGGSGGATHCPSLGAQTSEFGGEPNGGAPGRDWGVTGIPNCGVCSTGAESNEGIDGSPGSDGLSGQGGGACEDGLGLVVGQHWIAAPSSDGAAGASGSGGGGGGGGGGLEIAPVCNSNSVLGASGGGGGAGGCGGESGRAASGGGGSFGIFIHECSVAPVVANNEIVRGNGGSGGAGGAGGTGGIGGAGQAGGLVAGSGLASLCVGESGAGGAGGDGAPGGGGAGGCGGASFAIYSSLAGGAASYAATNTLPNSGSGGSGGNGGASVGNVGASGVTGVSTAVND